MIQKCFLFIGLAVLLLIALIALPLYFRKSAHPSPLASAQASYEFITRSGSHLLLNGQPFRFAGPNIFWLGLDEGAHGLIYPSHFRVDDALTTAQKMGATVVRAHTLGISVGCPLCVEPTLGTFNENALQHIDYAIQAAKAHHLRLIIPLTDNWHYYHGGKHTFTEWRKVAAETLFYSDKTVIADFEQYIKHLLNRVNSYTGIAYKNDPTILAWETGNEIKPSTSWTKTISSLIKNIDTHHLVMDGTTGVSAKALNLSTIDIFTDHYYPIKTSRLDADAQVATDKQKVFIVGEYDWTSQHHGDTLNSFLADIEQNNNIAGDFYWSLFAHNDNYGYTQHNDGYSFHYPGDTPDRHARIQALQVHAYIMDKLAVPALAVPGGPLITAIVGNKISWRGADIAATYSVERSSSGANGPWNVICKQCATDNNTPWTDSSMPKGSAWYRVQGYNLDGVAGPYSNVFRISIQS